MVDKNTTLNKLELITLDTIQITRKMSDIHLVTEKAKIIFTNDEFIRFISNAMLVLDWEDKRKIFEELEPDINEVMRNVKRF